MERAIERYKYSLLEENKIKLGYKRLDEFIKGLVRGRMLGIQGFVSHGKSTFAYNVLYNILKQGFHCYFHSFCLSF